MIERMGDIYTLTCDNCEDETELDSFKEAVQYKKDEGWRSVKNDDEDSWRDLCPDCQAPSIIRKMRGEE